MDQCLMLEKVARDNSYVFFGFLSIALIGHCEAFQKCEVVEAPFTEGSMVGGVGWLFPKRSPFLPLFNQMFWDLKEKGFMQRIQNQPQYNPNKLLSLQECETLDGQAISMLKVISLFSMLGGAACVSLLIFG